MQTTFESLRELLGLYSGTALLNTFALDQLEKLTPDERFVILSDETEHKESFFKIFLSKLSLDYEGGIRRFLQLVIALKNEQILSLLAQGSLKSNGFSMATYTARFHPQIFSLLLQYLEHLPREDRLALLQTYDSLGNATIHSNPKNLIPILNFASDFSNEQRLSLLTCSTGANQATVLSTLVENASTNTDAIKSILQFTADFTAQQKIQLLHKIILKATLSKNDALELALDYISSCTSEEQASLLCVHDQFGNSVPMLAVQYNWDNCERIIAKILTLDSNAPHVTQLLLQKNKQQQTLFTLAPLHQFTSWRLTKLLNRLQCAPLMVVSQVHTSSIFRQQLQQRLQRFVQSADPIAYTLYNCLTAMGSESRDLIKKARIVDAYYPFLAKDSERFNKREHFERVLRALEDKNSDLYRALNIQRKLTVSSLFPCNKKAMTYNALLTFVQEKHCSHRSTRSM